MQKDLTGWHYSCCDLVDAFCITTSQAASMGRNRHPELLETATEVQNGMDPGRTTRDQPASPSPSHWKCRNGWSKNARGKGGPSPTSPASGSSRKRKPLPWSKASSLAGTKKEFGPADGHSGSHQQTSIRWNGTTVKPCHV